jgi:hypothetical protein
VRKRKEKEREERSGTVRGRKTNKSVGPRLRERKIIERKTKDKKLRKYDSIMYTNMTCTLCHTN